MDKFFNPVSVAIFGVSDTPSNLGAIIVKNLDHFGFRGQVYAIGPKGGCINGKPILETLEKVPDIPDLAVVLVPARFVPSTLAACGEKGIKHVIIESGGFSEFADERQDLEGEVKEVARRYSMKVIGPNCFGVVNTANGVVLPFFLLHRDYMKRGVVSLISQSGGIFYDTCMLCSVENVGLNKLVSIGNKLLTDEVPLLRYLIDDPTTSVIGLYLEGFGDGRLFMEAARSSRKPIVVLKGNRSKAALEIARFHTTAIAGDDAVTDAAIAQAGAHRVTNFQEMIDCFKIFTLPLLRGRRLALISRSGGHGVLCADAAYRHGFETARFTGAFLKRMKEKKLNVIQATNPLDIGDVYDLSEYGPILEMALQEPGVDGVAFVVTYSSESDGEKIRDFLRGIPAMISRYDKPVAVCVATNRPEWFAVKEASDIPVFADIDLALAALKRSYTQHRFISGRKAAGEPRKRKTGSKVGPLPAGILPPGAAFGLLKEYGLPVAGYEITDSKKGAVNAAGRIGYPVVLKDATPGLLHKTETGGVVAGINSREALKRALAGMKADMYLVQKMAGPGREVMVGVRYDREFGHALVLSLGGVFVEAFRESVIRVAPVDELCAGEMIEELQGVELLKGFRGAPHADTRSLRSIIVRVSELVADHPEITAIDINPVIVHSEGAGCTVVDAKIEAR